MNSDFFKRFKVFLSFFNVLLIRDLKERYVASFLGFFWAILTPIIQIAVFWLIFSKFFRIKIPFDQIEIPFIQFFLSGMLPWLMFQESISRGVNSIVEKGGLIKKVKVPVFIFSILPVFSSLIIYGLGIIFYVIYLCFTNAPPDFFSISCFFIIIFLQIIFTCGINLFLSSLTVYIRDISQAIGFVLQFMLYMTTILYTMQMVPKEFQPLIKLNPMTFFIESYHLTLLYNRLPPPDMLIPIIISTVLSLIAGFFVYNKLKKGFQDVL